VVDFIIHSVAHILKAEFGQTLGCKGVHIIDPFTGTGTFITRLLQSGLIAPEDLPHKYKHEIHANELVLLAYYIAAINIEAVYHGIVGGKYQPFEGICLTDTFQMYEKEDLIDTLLVDNSARRKRQKKLDIRVIIGNPPYSVGQKDDHDDAANVRYPHLESRLQATYIKESTGNPRSLYDSYVKAIRWASDRVGNSGVISYVTNAGFVEGKAADGLRKCLAKEFSSAYVFHLRGLRGLKTSGERAKREGGQIFGSASGTAICILVLVKNPNSAKNGKIYFHDIGDYLTREQKLAKISEFVSIAGIEIAGGWKSITPDAHGDWIGQRSAGFGQFISLGAKSSNGSPVLFSGYSSGVKTNRDWWAYSSSKNSLISTMKRMIAFYNDAVDQKVIGDINDPTKIAWSWVLRGRFDKRQRGSFDKDKALVALYRPFEKRWLYYDGFFNENRYQMPRLFPSAHEKNLVIGVSATESRSAFSVLITDHVPSLHAVDMVGSQYFPLYLYDESKPVGSTQHRQPSLFEEKTTSSHPLYERRDAITAEGLAYFQAAYPGETIIREDIFYYVYGLLHSLDYRERFADNLGKELPRIPRVKAAGDFWAFSQAGRKLAELHLHYESVEPYPLKIDSVGKKLTDSDYRVEKMRYGKKGKDKDLTTLHYNDRITLTGIPLEAYDYVVNGKPALDWVVERQAIKTDKDSGIVNDANDWAVETVGNARYPLELFQRVVTVSLQTMKIIRELPRLDIVLDS